MRFDQQLDTRERKKILHCITERMGSPYEGHYNYSKWKFPHPWIHTLFTELIILVNGISITEFTALKRMPRELYFYNFPM